MNAVPSPPQSPHDVETCACPACQYFRYQRQYRPVPGPTIAPAPPNYALPPGAGPGNAGYYNPPGPGSTTPPPPPGWFPPAGYPPPAAGAGSDRAVASLAHWLPLVVALVLSFVIGAYAVFLCFIPPLIVMMTAKSGFIGEHARESLNFQLNVLIPGAVILVLSMASPPFGALLRLALFVSCLIIQIMAAVKASQGERYRYPVGIRFISLSRLRRAGP